MENEEQARLTPSCIYCGKHRPEAKPEYLAECERWRVLLKGERLLVIVCPNDVGDIPEWQDTITLREAIEDRGVRWV